MQKLMLAPLTQLALLFFFLRFERPKCPIMTGSVGQGTVKLENYTDSFDLDAVAKLTVE